MPRGSKDLDGVYAVRAGKFRRYHGRSKLAAALDVPTNAKNARDVVYTGVGMLQSRRLLRRLKPDVVFIKGSSVGVPIGKACKALHIPYFTHDSDSVASLTNRLLAKDAVVHAVGLPLSFYSRSDDKLRYTGIPLSDQYRRVSASLLQQYRRQLGLPEDALVIAVTGGSLGAHRLNMSFAAIAPRLLEQFPQLYILHQSGTQKSSYANLSAEQQKRVKETAFTDVLYAFTGAADVVVARAGATTIAELAVQAKPTIFVPNPELTGGQQTKNASFLDKHHAAIIVDEQQAADATKFDLIVADLLVSKPRRQELSEHFAQLAKDDAAKELTAIIVSLATK